MAHSTSTTHYELSQFASSDKPAWLVDYNGDMSKIDDGIYGAAQKAAASISNFADGFSSDATYDEGDYVTYNNLLYVCIAAVTAAGPWNPNNWQLVTVADIAASIPSAAVDYTNVTNKPQINGVTLTGNKTTSDLGITEGTVWNDVSSNVTINASSIVSFGLVSEKRAVMASVGSLQYFELQLIISLTAATTAVTNPIEIGSISGIDLGSSALSLSDHVPAVYDSGYEYASAGTVLGNNPVVWIDPQIGKIYLRTYNWSGAANHKVRFKISGILG